MTEWIVTSSALVLLMAVLRALVKDRIGPRLRYALWGLVLVRLLVPGTFWDSGASVINLAETRESYQVVSTLPNQMTLGADGHVQSMTGGTDSFQAQPGGPELSNRYGWVAVPDKQEAAALEEQGQRALDTASLKRLVDGKNLLAKVWLAGAAVTAALLLAVNLRFYVNLTDRRRRTADYRERRVYAVEGLASPCLFGLARPAVYITPELEGDPEALAHVLAHEYTHFRQGDHIWAALRGVCLALHWYNPLVWWAAAASRRDCELSCDAGAVKRLGEDRRADYGRTLVSLVTRRTAPGDLLRCATTMTGSRSALKERIALLVKRPRTTALMACAVAAVCCLAAACTFTGPAEKEPPAPEDVPPAEEGTEPEAPGQTQMVIPAITRIIQGEDVPMPDGLPTKVVENPPWGGAAIWLAAETEDGEVQAYYDPETDVGYLRRGDRFQQVDRSYVSLPQMFLPRIYLEDLDGDGERELLEILCLGSGTGAYVEEMTVYEWDDETGWTGYVHDPKPLCEDFNARRAFTIDEKTGTAHIVYGNAETDADVTGQLEVSGDTPLSDCFLSGQQVRYNWSDGQIVLTMDGEVTSDRIAWLCGYAFTYRCSLTYRDGTFTAGPAVLRDIREGDVPQADLITTPESRAKEQEHVDFTNGSPEEDWAEWLAARETVQGTDMPLPEELPTRLKESRWDSQLLGEVPEADIAVYYYSGDEGPRGKSKVMLRRGDRCQWFLQSIGASQVQLRWSDLDGDGEEELAVVYPCGLSGQEELVVYKWDDGTGWTASTYDPMQAYYDFSFGYTAALYREERLLTVSMGGQTAAVDLAAMRDALDLPGHPEKGSDLSCKLLPWQPGGCRWTETGALTVTLPGEMSTTAMEEAQVAFAATWTLTYQADGTFAQKLTGLESCY